MVSLRQNLKSSLDIMNMINKAEKQKTLTVMPKSAKRRAANRWSCSRAHAAVHLAVVAAEAVAEDATAEDVTGDSTGHEWLWLFFTGELGIKGDFLVIGDLHKGDFLAICSTDFGDLNAGGGVIVVTTLLTRMLWKWPLFSLRKKVSGIHTFDQFYFPAIRDF